MVLWNCGRAIELQLEADDFRAARKPVGARVERALGGSSLSI